MISWIGNVFIVIGLWQIGNRNRYAFIFSIMGETLWIWHSVLSHNWALAFICLVFNFMAVRSFVKWGRA